MKRKTWPLVLGVIVVGALAGVALGGRPTKLPAVVIPAATSTTVAATAAPSTVAPTVAPTTPSTAASTTSSTTTAPTGTTGG